MIDTILLAVCAVLAVLAFFGIRRVGTPTDKKAHKKKTWLKILLIAALYVASGRILTLLYGAQEREALEVNIFAPHMQLFGYTISQTIVVFWVVMVVVLLLALAFRLLVVPKFTAVPKGLQNALEASIDLVNKYTRGKVDGASDALACYMFTLAIALMGSEFAELFGVRPPTADLVMTFSLAIVTFILINYYGIKRKGALGRLKALSQPTPVILPIKILSDIAVPVSLACRLFGNMLGGMIVMDLLRMALGANGIGVPAVAGLYFNLFHPAIQAYIFITLSLTFISEAVE